MKPTISLLKYFLISFALYSSELCNAHTSKQTKACTRVRTHTHTHLHKHMHTRVQIGTWTSIQAMTVYTLPDPKKVLAVSGWCKNTTPITEPRYTTCNLGYRLVHPTKCLTVSFRSPKNYKQQQNYDYHKVRVWLRIVANYCIGISMQLRISIAIKFKFCELCGQKLHIFMVNYHKLRIHESINTQKCFTKFKPWI